MHRGQPDHDDLDPWQLRCPNGHSSFEPVDGHWFCPQCHKSDRYDSDGRYQELVDSRTGDRLGRAEVRRLERQARRQQ